MESLTPTLIERFKQCRSLTEKICSPLAVEDHVVQPVAEVSPPKWHLAHTTWFFENFILSKYSKDYELFDSTYPKLFNSYYKSQGEHWLQGQRGFLSRPLVSEVHSYRSYVTEKLLKLCDSDLDPKFYELIELGIQHEQQHQELLLMDIQRILWQNPTFPAYFKRPPLSPVHEIDYDFISFDEGLYEFGAINESFSYDNEGPRHKYYVKPFALANRPTTNREYLEFINDGGYSNPLLWLSEGWDLIQAHDWQAPLYWKKQGGEWGEFTLYGFHPLNLDSPVCHLSYYEAQAYAKWRGCRLPTEYEWERAATLHPKFDQSLFLSQDNLAKDFLNLSPQQQGPFIDLHGGRWEWTSSDYAPYPGYQQEAGALGEYNGKFMHGQRVLRGGCFATPKDHYHITYRNFYQAEKRWPFTGLRLAKEL